MTLSVIQGTDGKIKMIGNFTGQENSEDYYPVTEHGFLYMTKARLGAKSMTVNTAGRTKVKINGFADAGLYAYSMTPRSSDTQYVMRAYLAYTNEAGRTVYVYSDAVYTNYNALAD